MEFMSRKELIQRMKELESLGFNCSGCQGNCCTYEANSMMVTPIEALELKLYLDQTGVLSTQLKEKCQQTVQKYRLDHQSGNGRRSFIRRSYTCPFFNHQALGCPLPPKIKPYGCLAFNSHHSELKAGSHCYSEKELLIEREKVNAWEVQLNEKLREKFGIIWEKTSLPLALLELWDIVVDENDFI
jgi:Fe-S-cluster containining protein